MMNCVIAAAPSRRTAPVASSSCLLQLDVLPWIGITCGDRRKNLLPFRRLDPRSDRVDEGVPEHRNEVIFLQDCRLDLLCETLAFRDIGGGQVFGEFVVDFLDAEE